jgi:hypothetical protein
MEYGSWLTEILQCGKKSCSWSRNEVVVVGKGGGREWSRADRDTLDAWDAVWYLW